MAEELKLHRTWSSPFGLRAVWALHIKGIRYDTIYEDLSQKSPELLQHNPVHKKIPQDPYEKAIARFWAKFGEDKLLPSIWSVFTGQGNDKNEALGPAVQNLELLEEQLKEKTFFGGEEIGYLDLSLGWLAYLLDVFEEVMDLKFFDAAKFPLLSAWMIKFYDAPVIKEHWPPRDKLVTKFQLLHENYQTANAPK